MEAEEALINRHWDRAHRIAFGILGDTYAAEDVTQEAMLSVIGNIGRFDPLRPFAPWLHRIVSNRALDWVRSRARRAEVFTDNLDAVPDIGTFADGSDPVLSAALATLTPEFRAVIALRYVAGYGTNEIARMLDLPRGTVGSRLRRALDQLRNEMEAGDG